MVVYSLSFKMGKKSGLQLVQALLTSSVAISTMGMGRVENSKFGTPNTFIPIWNSFFLENAKKTNPSFSPFQYHP